MDLAIEEKKECVSMKRLVWALQIQLKYNNKTIKAEEYGSEIIRIFIYIYIRNIDKRDALFLLIF